MQEHCCVQLVSDIRDVDLGGKQTWDAVNTFLLRLKPLGKQSLVLR